MNKHKRAIVLFALMQIGGVAATAGDLKMLDMMDTLDQLDRADFDVRIEKANACTGARDFVCAELWLGKAVKLAKGEADRQKLQLASQRLSAERQAVDNERRQREQEEERIALRQQQEAARRRSERDEEDDSSRRGSTMSGLAVIAGMAANNYAAAQAQAQRRIQAAPSLLAKVESFPAQKQASLPVRNTVSSTYSGEPQQVSRSAQAPIGVQNVKPAAPSVSDRINLGAAGRGFTEAQAVRMGAAYAGMPPASLNAPPQSTGQAAESGSREPASVQSPGKVAQTSGLAAARKGTLYFIVYAFVEHSRKGSGRYLVEENPIPVEWTWPNPVDSDREHDIASEVRPKVMAAFRAYMEPRFPPCKGQVTPDGCWGLQVKSVYGTSPEQARSQVEQALRGMSGLERQNLFTYRMQHVYRPAR